MVRSAVKSGIAIDRPHRRVADPALNGGVRSAIDTANAAHVPTPANANDRLWYRITSDGTTVTVKGLIDNSGPPSDAAWSGAGVAYSSSDFPLTGGQVGFRATFGTALMRHFTLETDHDNNGVWTTEYDQAYNHPGGYATVAYAHDAAGNLTFDGVYAYHYDAWNRLVQVSNAYRDSGGVVQEGSIITTMRYDGLGRRIVKHVQHHGDHNAVQHAYYDGQRQIEHRNAQDQTLKQQVWGLDYVDELVQTSLNINPQSPTEQNCDRPFYALHDTQYNVLGIVEPTLAPDGAATGSRLVERYEYTPYGQRQVYGGGWSVFDVNGDGEVNEADLAAVAGRSGQSGGGRWDLDGSGLVNFSDIRQVPPQYGSLSTANDPKALTPRLGTSRAQTTIASWLVLNEVGHQGLHHDEATNLIYNRARMLHPTLGRFVQRDPLGYVDGMSVYAYYAGIRGLRDPFGTQSGYGYNDGVPDNYGYDDYHNDLEADACKPEDCCPVLAEKAQKWVTEGAIRLFELEQDVNDLYSRNPVSYNGHVRRLGLVNQRIKECASLLTIRCRNDRTIPLLSPRPFPVPSVAPAGRQTPFWTFGGSTGDAIINGVGHAATGVGLVAGTAATGGLIGAAVGGTRGAAAGAALAF